MKRFIGSLAVTISILLASASCSPIVDARGHGINKTDLKQVIEGQSTKEDIEALLGSPSTTSTFGPETWFYISATKERTGVFEPDVVKQNVLGVLFDESGVVQEYAQYTMKDGKVIDFVEKTTPTEGHSLGVLEQLLGNMGRFNSPGRQPGGSMGIPGR